MKLDSFSPLSVDEVRKLILASSIVSCSLNPIPKWLVKSCLDVLAPFITYLVNLSLSHEYVRDRETSTQEIGP